MRVERIVLPLKYRNVHRGFREAPMSCSEPSSLDRHLPTTLTLLTHDFV